ncbi:MAG TPA: hypothetical protein VHS78_14595 [Candidatus Elarobacter sp.]|jgi:hypothetical protein|nr:hypothetical protein [Candidatus Elarobacter sp.]
MNPKHPKKDPPGKDIPPREIRFSPEVIAAAEKSAGRSLRSDVPELPREEQPQR